MTEIATIDWFGCWGHLFSLKTLLYLTIELDEINSRKFIHKCVVSSQYVGTRTTIQVLLVHELFVLSKIIQRIITLKL